MAFTNVMVLDRIEVAQESTRGTAIATMTRPVVYPHGRASWTFEADEALVPETLRSYFATNSDYTTVGISRSRINIEFIASYEELPWWFDHAIGGTSLTGSTTGSTPAGYTYATIPVGTSDDLKTMTLKCGDAASPYKFGRGAVNSMTLRWNPAGTGMEAYWIVTVEILAQFLGATTFDAPTALTRHKIPAKGTIVYVDAAAGTIGSTAASGVIRSGSVTITNNIEEKIFTEDTSYTSADFSRGEQMVSFDIARELTADTEYAFLRAGTTRKIRIQNTGDNIGGTPTTDYRLRVDIPVARYTPRLAPNWQGQNRVVPLQGRGLVDSDDTAPISIAVVNASSTLTA